MNYLDSKSDLDWLFETHLKERAGERGKYHAAVFYGNEDCPDKIELYVERRPTVSDTPSLTFNLCTWCHAMVAAGDEGDITDGAILCRPCAADTEHHS